MISKVMEYMVGQLCHFGSMGFGWFCGGKSPGLFACSPEKVWAFTDF